MFLKAHFDSRQIQRLAWSTARLMEALLLFLEQAVPVDRLLVDVGRHAVPVLEFFAAWEHERAENDSTDHAIYIIVIVIIIIIIIIIISVMIYGLHDLWNSRLWTECQLISRVRDRR